MRQGMTKVVSIDAPGVNVPEDIRARIEKIVSDTLDALQRLPDGSAACLIEEPTGAEVCYAASRDDVVRVLEDGGFTVQAQKVRERAAKTPSGIILVIAFRGGGAAVTWMPNALAMPPREPSTFGPN